MLDASSRPLKHLICKVQKNCKLPIVFNYNCVKIKVKEMNQNLVALTQGKKGTKTKWVPSSVPKSQCNPIH